MKLGYIGTFVTGGTPSRKHPEYYHGNIPWVSSTALGNPFLSEENVNAWITEDAIYGSSTKLIKKNSLLVGIRVGVGKCTITSFSCCTSQDVVAIENIDLSRWHLPYIRNYILSKHNLFEKEKRGATIKGITTSFLKELDLPEISLKEQIQVSNILEKNTKIIAAYQQSVDILDHLVKSRFVEVFGDPEVNPRGWEKVTLNDVCSSIVRGPFGSALKKEFFVEHNDSTYKVYEQKHAIQKSATIGTYYITEEKYQELKRFECVTGDILMSCSGTMGELYQLPEGCERGIINQALCKFTLNDRILPICFLTYMRQTIGNLETKGSGIKNIAAVSYVKQMPINLPPMEVQKEFEVFCKQVDKSKLAYVIYFRWDILTLFWFTIA